MTLVPPTMVPASPVSFEEVIDVRDRCRWPFEEGWCGAPTERRKPFCAEHAARAYLPREVDSEQTLLAAAGLLPDPTTTDRRDAA